MDVHEVLRFQREHHLSFMHLLTVPEYLCFSDLQFGDPGLKRGRLHVQKHSRPVVAADASGDLMRDLLVSDSFRDRLPQSVACQWEGTYLLRGKRTNMNLYSIPRASVTTNLHPL